jgi:putative redox protein
MEVHITQIEEARFSVQARNHTIVCDQPAENGGADAGMTPPELLLAALGACAAFYAAEYLRTRTLANSGVTASVTAEKLKGPTRVGNFHIRIDCPVSLTAEQHEGLMRSVEHCLVKNTLLNPPQIEVSLEVPCSAGVNSDSREH